MDSVALVRTARALIDIDSTTGHEAEASAWVTGWLKDRGYSVVEQQVADDRVNIIATIGQTSPDVVLSTHIDCVPPFFPSREDGDKLYGRGACDAKGILAAMLAALERLRAGGEARVGLLVVVGEERGSQGAQAANGAASTSRYLINGEPTGNRLGAATRGVYRVRLRTTGRAAHSAYPELGESAIDKLLDALIALRSLPLPDDPALGMTSYTVGLISGGIAPNVVPPTAEADVNFRTIGPAADVRASLSTLGDNVTLDDIVVVPPVTLTTVPGFETAVFPFTTDIPFLTAWGEPLLFGPGSVLVAHTDDEHVSIDALHAAVDHYARIAATLLARL